MAMDMWQETESTLDGAARIQALWKDRNGWWISV